MRIRSIRTVALVLGGPALGLLAWALLPEETLGSDGRIVAGLALWMALWWLTEVVPVAATALLPMAVLPLAGLSPRTVAAQYAHPLIFLFLGGFLLALAVERWGLHRRLALMTLSIVGHSPRRISAGVMVATALMSMWISNTATALVMLPIAVSLAESVGEEDDEGSRRLRPVLALSVAYGASIGGIGTLVGTPPNLFLASFARDHLDVSIDFSRWLLVGIPLVALLLPLAWWLLTGPLFRLGDAPLNPSVSAREALRGLGPPSSGEWRVALVFGLVAAMWVFRPWLTGLEIGGMRPLAHLTDSGSALLGGLALFALPGEEGHRLLEWPDTARLPWGTLVLFGGGLALAKALESSGVTAALGAGAERLGAVPPWLGLLVVTTVVIFLTELTSNTATTATLVPVLAAMAPALGLAPLQLATAAAVAASCAFMLPVATPPNAIVFGSGHVTMAEMRRAGLWLNAVAIVVVTLVSGLLLPRVFP
ncbi:MAG: SLC13/DASS family transporter [Deltaproteobacteria bacterium]|nr:MAG: SLC13/DASS family transporter [Deltaproteobacteria bacterium]